MKRTITIVILALCAVFALSNMLNYFTSKLQAEETSSEAYSYIADTIDVKQVDNNERTDIITSYTVKDTPDTIVVDRVEYSLTAVKTIVKKNDTVCRDVSKKAISGVYSIIVNLPHEDGAEYVVGIELEYTSKDTTQTRHLYKEYIPQK